MGDVRDWYERPGTVCRHGYEYGDCPEQCAACGHRCELHRGEGCEAVECGCPEWVGSEDDGDNAN